MSIRIDCVYTTLRCGKICNSEKCEYPFYVSDCPDGCDTVVLPDGKIAIYEQCVDSYNSKTHICKEVEEFEYDEALWYVTIDGKDVNKERVLYLAVDYGRGKEVLIARGDYAD